MIIAALAVVALVLVGIVSGALFARSACAGIGPDAIADRSISDLSAVVDAAFNGLADAERDAIVDAVTQLAGQLGPVTGVADVTGAEALTVVDGGVAAIGAITTVLDEDGSRARATAELGEAATVVGGGDRLYSLALVNPLTGQVDGLQPVDLDLVGGTCVDTALVGSPLAFYLDAGDGQLALFRAQEDADDPEIELRDPIAGRVWAADLEVATAPPGVLGEWVTARLGPDQVVAARRSAPDEPQPVVVGFDRRDGAVRWAIDRDELSPVLPSSVPARTEVVLNASELIVLRSVAETTDGAPDTDAAITLAGLDPADGSLRWTHELEPGAAVVDVAEAGSDLVVLVAAEGGLEARRIRSGDASVLAAVDAATGHLAALADGRVVVAADRGVVVTPEDQAELAGAPVETLDVQVHDGRITLLLRGEERDGRRAGAIAVTFGA
jgi:hypothetical protein